MENKFCLTREEDNENIEKKNNISFSKKDIPYEQSIECVNVLLIKYSENAGIRDMDVCVKITTKLHRNHA